MVRVNTNLLLGGQFNQAGATSIVIPSSPQLPPFQRRRSETPDPVFPDLDHATVAAGAASNNAKDPGDVILVPSTPESSPLPASRHQSQRAADHSDSEWTFPGIAAQPDCANGTAAAADKKASGHPDPEPAIRRRRDWTPPPPDTIVLNSGSSAAAAETWSSPRNASAKQKQYAVFMNLRDSFTCKDDEASTPNLAARPVGEKDDALTARRAIEMVPAGDSAPSPVKQKAPKRKARTITELAVAAYATPSSVDDNVSVPVAVTKGRAATGKTAGRAKEAVINPGLPLTKARKGIKARPKEKAKRGACQAVLLSPQSAMAESSAQDFVFGTSSQLAGDESPTFLRALHTAIRSSNQQDQQDAGLFDVDSVDLSSRTTTTHPRLWAVGARMDGKLTFDNVVDLEDDISFPEDPEAIVRAQQAVEARIQLEELETGIAEKASEPPKLSSGRAGAKKKVPALPPPESKRPVSASPPRQAERSLSQDQKTVQPKNARPNYETLTTTQLTTQVASYGYKPIRERKAMVALLSQCWEAQNQPPTKAFHTSASDSTAAPASPAAKRKKIVATAKKASGSRLVEAAAAAPPNAGMVTQTRAQRSAAKARPPVFEIRDSESDGRLSLSPELPSSSPVSQDDLAMDATDDDADMSLAETPTGEESELFALITRAVATTPRTKDPASPSWHEKILLYDTIILETFTAWLNDGQLAVMGYTDTVTTAQAKKWCESKSVCCTMKYSLHGKERKL